MNLDKLKKEYNGFFDIILQGINSKPLKVSESEFDPVFINNYFLVMREVEKQIDIEGDLHVPYQRWNLIKDIYKKKYNIDWESPKEMNPRVMFD